MLARNLGEIYVLIDTRLSSDTESYLKSRWKGKIYVNIILSNARGSAILVRKNTEIKNCVFRIIDKGNFSTLHFDYDNKRLALNAIYGPNTNSPLHFNEFF